MSDTTRDDIGVLIVDDDASIRMILTELFRDAGFRVDQAEDPFIAIQKLGMARFDVIFSDINMPGMTGIQLLGELRKENNDVRVVIMTADATLDSAIEATRLGAQDYLHKPFKNLDAVLDLANSMAAKVRDARAKEAAVGSLLAAAKTAGETSGGELGALAEKAERLLGIQVSAASPASENKSAQELSGDIAEFPIHEILQLLGMMRKTGILRVTPPGPNRAAISIVSGNVYAARFGPASDLKAMYRLMSNEHGMFHFQPTPQPPSVRRIEQSTEWVIMEGVRHMDEVGALGAAKPPLEIEVRYNGALHVPGATVVDRFDLTVADRIRKFTVVGSLLDTMPDPDLDIYESLIRLRKAKALELRRAPVPAAQP